MRIEQDTLKGLRSWEIGTEEVWGFFLTVMVGCICLAAVSCQHLKGQPVPPIEHGIIITATPVAP